MGAITIPSVARPGTVFTGTKAARLQAIDPGKSVATCGSRWRRRCDGWLRWKLSYHGLSREQAAQLRSSDKLERGGNTAQAARQGLGFAS